MIDPRLPLAVLGTLLLGCNDTPGVLTDTGTPLPGTGTTTGEPGDPDTTSGSSSSSGGDTTTGDGTSTGSTEESSTTGPPPIMDMGCPECLVIADGLEGGRGLALEGGYVYWTDQDAGTVSRAPIDGGDEEVLAENQDAPYGVAATGGEVYWTSFVEMGTVQRRSIEGGPTFALAADAFPRFMQIVGDWVYWCSFDDVLGRVRRVPTEGVGNPPETLVSVGSGVADLVVAGDQVYFTAHLPPEMPGLAPRGIVYAASSQQPTDEADLTELAIEQAEPWGIARHDKTIYWINGTGNPMDLPRRVLSIPTLGDNEPTTLAVQQSNPWGIAADEQWVYWTDFTDVKAVTHDGSTEIQLAELQNYGRSVVTDDDYVYWITKNRVLRLAKPAAP